MSRLTLGYSGPMPADPARRSQESWRAILDAAYALFVEGGYQSVTVGGIAARAGVGRQTLYRWWPSKAAVVFEAFLDKVSIGPFPADGPRPADSPLPADGDLATLLRAYAHGFLTLYVDGAGGSRLRELIGAAQTDPDLARAMAEQWFEPRRAPVREALREAQRAGLVRADVDPDTALDLVFAPLHYRLLVSGQPLDAAYADAVVDLCLHALR
ncbi:TetR/AcrR family transcriptional regulator [Microbispora hainanensis]|uniref:TetR/AcrR family transcriptional regulator n=2 Tax=Microbispora hainanensis TaxID=568844 RepID=A0A544YWJ4_9ACTN|nr:TetR/AcrR family transcriptional regulator [Microbispora hainanensis]